MTPLFTMPSSAERHRMALVSDVRMHLGTAHCLVRLLHQGIFGARERELLDRLHDELTGVTRALDRLERER